MGQELPFLKASALSATLSTSLTAPAFEKGTNKTQIVIRLLLSPWFVAHKFRCLRNPPGSVMEEPGTHAFEGGGDLCRFLGQTGLATELWLDRLGVNISAAKRLVSFCLLSLLGGLGG